MIAATTALTMISTVLTTFLALKRATTWPGALASRLTCCTLKRVQRYWVELVLSFGWYGGLLRLGLRWSDRPGLLTSNDKCAIIIVKANTLAAVGCGVVHSTSKVGRGHLVELVQQIVVVSKQVVICWVLVWLFLIWPALLSCKLELLILHLNLLSSVVMRVAETSLGDLGDLVLVKDLDVVV